MSKRKTLEEKFFGRFEVIAESGCWEWSWGRFNNGYGVISHLRKNLKAHRVSYMIHKGEIPEGMLVCHTCDNPPCVNPDHLFLGTVRDNTQDMIKKGRKVVLRGDDSPLSRMTGPLNPFYGRRHSAKSLAQAAAKRSGVKNWQAKLDDEMVQKIYSRRNESYRSLGREFGISGAAVWQIFNGYSWNHVTGLPRKSRPQNEYRERKAREAAKQAQPGVSQAGFKETA